MICYNDFMHHDYREEMAAMQYILYNTCKKRKNNIIKDNESKVDIHTDYIPLDFLVVRWIVNRANFYLACDHGLTLISMDFLNWFNEVPFVPESFMTDYTAEFSYDTKTLIESGKYPEYTYKSFLSGAELFAMNKAIKRYKLYGKIWLYISYKWFKIKCNIKDKIKRRNNDN